MVLPPFYRLFFIEGCVSTKRELSEEQEIELIQSGETALFERIVHRYTPVLFSLCYRMQGNREESEDAVQEIFVKAYHALDSFDTSRRFYSWIYTIAVNHLRSLNRKKGRSPSLSVPYEETVSEEVRRDSKNESPDTTAIKRNGEQLAQSALDELDEKYREVFLLRMVEGMSSRDTARILDMPENTVKTHVRRAREKLVEKMKNFGWE